MIKVHEGFILFYSGAYRNENMQKIVSDVVALIERKNYDLDQAFTEDKTLKFLSSKDKKRKKYNLLILKRYFFWESMSDLSKLGYRNSSCIYYDTDDNFNWSKWGNSNLSYVLLTKLKKAVSTKLKNLV